jgi:hypothetical protein
MSFEWVWANEIDINTEKIRNGQNLRTIICVVLQYFQDWHNQYEGGNKVQKQLRGQNCQSNILKFKEIRKQSVYLTSSREENQISVKVINYNCIRHMKLLFGEIMRI